MNIDLKNIREAVAILDEIKLDLEVLKSQLSNNFKNYQNIGDISAQNIDKFESVLESINTLQINAENSVKDAIKNAIDLKQNMSEYYTQEFTQTKKDFDTLVSGINDEFGNLKNTIYKSMQDGVDNINIDTSELEKKIIKAIDQVNLFELEKFLERMGQANISLNNASINLNNTSKKLDETSLKIIEKASTALDDIGRAKSSLTMATTLFLAMGFTIFGFLLSTYFKIDALSDYYFEDYNNKLQNLEQRQIKNEKELKNMDQLSKFLKEHKVKVIAGKYNNTNYYFLRFENVIQNNEYTFNDKQYHFVGVK